jgi:hypothetical protein
MAQIGGVPVSSGAVDAWGNRVIITNVPNNVNQATAANQPTLVANDLNFNPVVRFDGVADFLRLNGMNSGYRGTGDNRNQYSVFMVGRFNFNGPLIGHENSTSSATTPIRSTVSAAGISTTNTISSVTTTEDYDATTAMSGLQLGAYIYSSQRTTSPFPNGSFSAFLNGNANGTATTSIGLPTSTGDYLVGANAAGTSFFEGDMAEVVVYANSLMAAQPSRRRVDTYLSLKWGTTLAAGTAYNYESSNGTTVWTGNASQTVMKTLKNCFFAIPIC